MYRNQFTYDQGGTPQSYVQQQQLQGLASSNNHPQQQTNVDCEEQLYSLFKNFQDDFTYEELTQFLDRCNEGTYDRNIAAQLFEACPQVNQRIQAVDFINQFVDTDRNLNFRINLQQSEMDELVRQKNALITELKSSSTAQSNKIIISGLSAHNIEPIESFRSVDAFVQIRTDSADLATTQIVPNNQNPSWEEAFTVEVNPGQAELYLIVNDRARVLMKSEIGRVTLNLAELQQAKSLKKKSHLVRGEFRTPSSLSYEAKFMLSDSKIAQERLREKEEEIKQKQDQMKPNKIFLARLMEIFSSYKSPFSNGAGDYSRGGGIQNSRNKYMAGNGTTSGYLPDMNRSVNVMGLSAYYFPHIREQRIEQKALEKIDSFANEYVDDWARITLILFAATTAFSIFQSLYKPQFFELTLLLIFMCLCFSGILTQTQHRFISVMLIGSWILDLIWLIFLSRNWYDLNGPNTNDGSIKTFVIVISIISSIFVKLPFMICLWRAYFQFDKFKEQVANRLKTKHLQLNGIQSLTMSAFDSRSQGYPSNTPGYGQQQQISQNNNHATATGAQAWGSNGQQAYTPQYQANYQQKPQQQLLQQQQQQQQLLHQQQPPFNPYTAQYVGQNLPQQQQFFTLNQAGGAPKFQQQNDYVYG